jgi:hypothetical protein
VIVKRGQSGQVAAEFALALAFLFGFAVTGFQFVGLSLTQAKVSHAAQEAAYVAGSIPHVNTDQAPCWAVTNGLQDPAQFSDSAVCRTVVENLGDLNINNASVAVWRDTQGTRAYHVIVNYREAITSPLLQIFFGSTLNHTAEAASY